MEQQHLLTATMLKLNEHMQKLIVLGLSISVILLRGWGSVILLRVRDVSFFLQPRFWAEEGSLFFANAYSYAQTQFWYKGLTFTRHGYFALWPNLATTIAANLVQLEFAPLVTTLFAFVVQLIPISIILWSRSSFWSTRERKIFGILIVLFTPLNGETWLNTITSQFHFSLVAFLLILEQTNESRVRDWINRILLVFAGLTGPVSCFLIPIFAFRVWSEKQKERLVQLLILTGCLIVQVTLMTTSKWSTVSDRVISFGFSDVVLILWTQSVGLVFTGLHSARKFFGALDCIRQQDAVEIAVIPTLVAESGIFWLLSRRLSSSERLIFLGGYFLIIILSIIGSIGDKQALINTGSGQRYFLIPNIILLFLVLANIDFQKEKVSSGLYVILLAFSLYLGMRIYQETSFASRSWPVWKEQVHMWREHPEHELEIWPPPNWKVTLRKYEK